MVDNSQVVEEYYSWAFDKPYWLDAENIQTGLKLFEAGWEAADAEIEELKRALTDIATCALPTRAQVGEYAVQRAVEALGLGHDQ